MKRPNGNNPHAEQPRRVRKHPGGARRTRTRRRRRAPHQSNRSILNRVQSEPGGTVYANQTGTPAGWVVSITNHEVRGGLSNCLARVRLFADLFGRLNPSVSNRLVIGWWRNHLGKLFLDVGLVLLNRVAARHVAATFRQQAVAHLGRSRVRIVDVSK